MQLYHHAFSMNSQKVRLALEEKGIDYISHSLNPIKGKDLNADLFHVSPDGKMPVFQNGNLILTDTLAIVQFIDSLNEPLGGYDVNKERVHEWMRIVDEWEPKLFTLSSIPLKRAYATDEMMKDTEALEQNKRQLERLLDMAEEQLESSEYLAGESFTMADVMFLPLLGWMELLGVSREYINKKRKNLSRYWAKVKRRPSYYAVIGKYFGGVNRYKTLLTNSIIVSFQTLIRRY
ncbi:hypothetical protein GOP47_0018603 [Adiantum capillus-veneris]|uniref:Glutathione S-transferase n=1 Tax=Adiantum capillus-veneris TaxID=13818 RepID=A0A9D4Z8Y5_ADICA|nr:hypothetical protein GOP47_0018603 [Adiantum capillus-veneris]